MTEESPNRAGLASDVFVSYASLDAATASSVVEALERQGIRCWIAPRDVTPGSQYADEIVGAINNSKIVVLVLSEHAVASSHVGKEVERASSKKRRIIALRTDAAALTRALEYFLSESQWIDVPALGMQIALNKLAETVAQGPKAPWHPSPASDRVDRVSPGRFLKRVAGASAAVIALAIGIGLGVHYWWSHQGIVRPTTADVPTGITSSGVPISDKSIAVLPFTNMSENRDQEYFSDGLSEDLITALAQIPGLKVIGRTSSFNFRHSSDDSKTIGAKLRVAHLLEGSVRHAGDTVRVSAELIDTSDGTTQWSERYDRPYKDLFELQDDLTRAVGEALKAHLVPRANASVQQTDRPASGNMEAYNAVLEGKYFLARETDAGTRKAIECFTRATQLDPRYAFAWSSLSRAWTDLGGYHVDLSAAPEAYAHARVAANTALALAPDMTSAHIARGWLLETADLNWRDALAEYRRAFELAPRNGEAAASLARQLATFGEVDRAVELTLQALATDPLYSRWHGWLGNYFRDLNRLEEAEGAIRTAIELQPGAVRLHFVLSDIEIRRGNAPAALAAARQEPVGSVFRDAALARALQNSNDRSAADAALKTLLDRGASWDPYDVAQIYAMRNDANKTFEWLDRAWSYRDPSIRSLPHDVFIGRFKDDPRFIAYCRKVGLPVPGVAQIGSQ